MYSIFDWSKSDNNILYSLFNLIIKKGKTHINKTTIQYNSTFATMRAHAWYLPA